MTSVTVPAATPILHLTVIDGSSVESLRITGSLTRIGRESMNDLVLRDKYISSRHAEIELVGDRVRLRDLRSTNGTRVRRHRWIFAVDHLCGHEAWLEDGDELLFGQPSQQVLVRMSIVVPAQARDTPAPDGATIVESLSCRAMPDVAERFGRGALTAVQALASRLRPKDDPSVLLEAFATGLLEQFPKATHVGVHLLDEATGSYLPSVMLTRSGPEPTHHLSRTVRDQVLEHGEGVLFVGNQSASLQEAAIQSGLCAPLFTGDRVPGLVQVDRRGMIDGGFTRRDLGLLVVVAHQAALVLELSMMHASLRRTVERAIGGVVAAMEARDQYMVGHAQAVADLSRRIAQRLALDPTQASIVSRAGALHDVGRFGVPREILNKPGPLTAEEFDAIKEQPEIGAALLERCEVLPDLVPVIRHLHENWDGTGYPEGLAGDAIPLGARIVAVADAFHTLVSHRAHRQALAEPAALAEMLRCSGRRFDPRLVGVLEELVAKANDGWNDDMPTIIGWAIDPSGRPAE